MPFDTFPIPEPQPSVAEVNARLIKQRAMLGEVLMDLQTNLYSRLEGQQALLETVTQPLMTSISRRNTNNINKLKTVVTPLMQEIAERNSVDAAQVQQLQLAAGGQQQAMPGDGVWAVYYSCVTMDVSAYWIAVGSNTRSDLSLNGWQFYREYGTDAIAAHTAASDPMSRAGILSLCPGHASVSSTTSAYVTPVSSPVSTTTTTSTPVATPSPSPSPAPRPVIAPPTATDGWNLWRQLQTGCQTWRPANEPGPASDWYFQQNVASLPYSAVPIVWPALVPLSCQTQSPVTTGPEKVPTGPERDYPVELPTPIDLGPIPPFEPPPPAAVGSACDSWWGWVTPLAPPGSPEWCQWADITIKGMETLDAAIDAQIQTLLNPDTIDTALDGVPTFGKVTFPPGYIIDALVNILKQLAKAGRPVMQALGDAYRCLRELEKKLFTRCNLKALTVLMNIKVIIRSIQRTRLGTDAFAWITIDVVIPLEPLEQTVDYLIHYVCPVEAPSVGEAIEAWLRGYVSDDLLHCVQRIHGQEPDAFAPYVKARGEFISPKEAIQYVRRQGGGTQDEKDWLRKLGFIDDVQTTAFQELYWEIPTIGDHLEWLRKNVFDSHYVRDFKLLDGFGTPEDIADVGYPDYVKMPETPDSANFWARFGKDLTTLGMRKENAALHFAAHWLNPSFTQLFDMTQRLRPGRVPEELVFTTADLLRVMQEMDVGPYFRKRLERVSHPVINLTLLMKLFGLRAITADDFVERLQDLGYTHDDAIVMRDGLVFEIARLRASSGRGWTPTVLARLFALGIVSDDFVTSKMALLGYSDVETGDLLDRAPKELQARTVQRVTNRTLNASINTTAQAYKCGALAREDFVVAMDGYGIKQDTANTWADQIDSAVDVDLCKQNVSAIRSAVFKGRIDMVAARQRLDDMGVPDKRASQYIKSWTVQLGARSPAASASQILRWVAEGLMDADTATTRLTNLGWQDADITIQLAEAKGRLAIRRARSEAAKARDERTQAKELAQLVLDGIEDTERLKRNLKTVESPSRLQKWLKLDVIDDGYFAERMMDLGFGPDVIAKYQEEINSVKRAKAAKDAAKQAEKNAPQPGFNLQPGGNGGPIA